MNHNKLSAYPHLERLLKWLWPKSNRDLIITIGWQAAIIAILFSLVGYGIFAAVKLTESKEGFDVVKFANSFSIFTVLVAIAGLIGLYFNIQQSKRQHKLTQRQLRHSARVASFNRELALRQEFMVTLMKLLEKYDSLFRDGEVSMRVYNSNPLRYEKVSFKKALSDCTHPVGKTDDERITHYKVSGVIEQIDQCDRFLFACVDYVEANKAILKGKEKEIFIHIVRPYVHNTHIAHLVICSCIDDPDYNNHKKIIARLYYNPFDLMKYFHPAIHSLPQLAFRVSNEYVKAVGW